MAWKSCVLISADKHHKYCIIMHFHTVITELFSKSCSWNKRNSNTPSAWILQRLLLPALRIPHSEHLWPKFSVWKGSSLTADIPEVLKALCYHDEQHTRVFPSLKPGTRTACPSHVWQHSSMAQGRTPAMREMSIALLSAHSSCCTTFLYLPLWTENQPPYTIIYLDVSLAL